MQREEGGGRTDAQVSFDANTKHWKFYRKAELLKQVPKYLALYRAIGEFDRERFDVLTAAYKSAGLTIPAEQ